MKKVWVKSRTTNVDVFSIEINGEENIENLKDAIITKMKFTYAAPLLKVLTVSGGSEFFIQPGTLINTVLSDSTNSQENPIYFKEPEGKSVILTEIIFYWFNVYLLCPILIYTPLY